MNRSLSHLCVSKGGDADLADSRHKGHIVLQAIVKVGHDRLGSNATVGSVPSLVLTLHHMMTPHM